MSLTKVDFTDVQLVDCIFELTTLVVNCFAQCELKNLNLELENNYLETNLIMDTKLVKFNKSIFIEEDDNFEQTLKFFTNN